MALSDKENLQRSIARASRTPEDYGVECGNSTGSEYYFFDLVASLARRFSLAFSLCSCFFPLLSLHSFISLSLC